MNDLSFVEAVDRLGASIVIGISNAADKGLNARFGLALGVVDADILRAPVEGMHEAAAMNRPPFVQGLLESVEHEARMRCPAHAPANDATSIVFSPGI